MTYEELIIEHPDVDVRDRNFSSSKIKGLYCDGNVAINSNIDTQKEKACILAEELGHHYTSSGTIIDMSDTNNRKQEHLARVWAYKRMITLESIIEAFENGCRNAYDFADYLEVTEPFLIEAMEHFKQKYGCHKKVGDYTLVFYPHFDVMKSL